MYTDIWYLHDCIVYVVCALDLEGLLVGTHELRVLLGLIGVGLIHIIV
jgi:hypothetical protein